ncbi:glycosyltransferase family 4 protein [Pedobacter sp.]|uniref:glycosyltransferase family 4 protein n=1 Tax=Pedobacter sp. TaxID=1411316 RepID=UPI003C4403D8
MNKKLAIVSTHPIQYYAPVFKLLAQEIEIKIFYTQGDYSLNKFDLGFKQKIEWDLPLLDGYDYTFVENNAKDRGTHHFNGINNPTLITQIKDYQPQAVLVYGWAWKSHLKAIRYFKGRIPVYFRGDSTLFSKTSKWKTLFKPLFLKWVYSHVDLAFYVGKANKAYFKKYGLNEKQLVFAPHAIDNERFSENRAVEVSALREKLGIGNEEVLLLFSGKFDMIKNPDILLDAFLKLDLKNVYLLFVGNGALEEKLKATSEKQKTNNNRIYFMDFQNQTQMPSIYQACDLFCLPSRSETWGLAVNEAMACGKAILVSDQVGCAIDLVKPQVNGDIFKSEDLEDLKNKLLSFVANKSRLVTFGETSKTIIKDWSFERQVMILLQTINV